MYYLYSAINNCFISSEALHLYSEEDISCATKVSDDVFLEFCEWSKDGRVRAAGSDGLPCWVVAPKPPHADIVAQADAQKTALQREAEEIIKPLDRAKSLGVATPDEIALLLEWEKYSVYLMRVDTSTAPDITWPVKPSAT